MNVFRSEIRTGLLVISAIVILVLVLLYLGAPGVFVPQKEYLVYVQNASGLRQGNEVLLAGRRIGQVLSLYSPVPEAERPEGHPELEAVIKIQVAKNANIYNEVTVLLTQNGFLGEMLIDFVGGREQSGVAAEGARFLATRPPGLDQAVPAVMEKLTPVLTEAQGTLQSLEKAADGLANLASKGGEVELTLQEFRRFGSQLNELTGEDGSLRRSFRNLEELTGEYGRLNQSLANIQDMTDSESSLVKTLANAEQFTRELNDNKDIDATLRNFRKTSEQLQSTLNGLTGQFSIVAGNLEQASDTVKRQPWRLIWPSTKKYPEEQPPTPAPRERERQRRR